MSSNKFFILEILVSYLGVLNYMLLVLQDGPKYGSNEENIFSS